MGILDKIMFWKKKDEFADIGLGDKENLAFGKDFGQQPGANPPGMEPGLDLGQSPDGQQPSPGFQSPQPPPPSFPPPTQPQFQPQPPGYASPRQDLESKNLEIISSKLDALRASIESLSQRMANLETIARGEEQGKRRRYY